MLKLKILKEQLAMKTYEGSIQLSFRFPNNECHKGNFTDNGSSMVSSLIQVSNCLIKISLFSILLYVATL